MQRSWNVEWELDPVPHHLGAIVRNCVPQWKRIRSRAEGTLCPYCKISIWSELGWQWCDKRFSLAESASALLYPTRIPCSSRCQARLGAVPLALMKFAWSPWKDHKTLLRKLILPLNVLLGQAVLILHLKFSHLKKGTITHGPFLSLRIFMIIKWTYVFTTICLSTYLSIIYLPSYRLIGRVMWKWEVGQHDDCEMGLHSLGSWESHLTLVKFRFFFWKRGIEMTFPTSECFAN